MGEWLRSDRGGVMGWSFVEESAAKPKLHYKVRLDLMEEMCGKNSIVLWRDSKSVVKKFEAEHVIGIRMNRIKYVGLGICQFSSPAFINYSRAEDVPLIPLPARQYPVT